MTKESSPVLCSSLIKAPSHCSIIICWPPSSPHRPTYHCSWEGTPRLNAVLQKLPPTSQSKTPKVVSRLPQGLGSEKKWHWPSGDKLIFKKEGKSKGKKEGKEGRRKPNILYNISMTYTGVISLITSNQKLLCDPEFPDRALPIIHTMLSPPMHRFI